MLAFVAIVFLCPQTSYASGNFLDSVFSGLMHFLLYPLAALIMVGLISVAVRVKRPKSGDDKDKNNRLR